MKRFKIITISLLILSAITAVIVTIGSFSGKIDLDGAFGIILGCSIFTFIISLIISLFVFIKNIDTAFLILIGVTLLGIYFKRNHWGGAGVLLIIGLGFSCIGFIILAVKSLVFIKGNRFLSILAFFCSITLFMCYAGTLWKIQNFPGARFAIYALIPYLITSVAIIFSLPNSNFIEWIEAHKRILLRAIFIPWLFFFILSSALLLLPPHISQSILSKDISSEEYWDMVDYEMEGPQIAPDERLR